MRTGSPTATAPMYMHMSTRVGSLAAAAAPRHMSMCTSSPAPAAPMHMSMRARSPSAVTRMHMHMTMRTGSPAAATPTCKCMHASWQAAAPNQPPLLTISSLLGARAGASRCIRDTHAHSCMMAHGSHQTA